MIAVHFDHHGRRDAHEDIFTNNEYLFEWKSQRKAKGRETGDDDLHRVCHVVGPSIQRQNEATRDIPLTTHTRIHTSTISLHSIAHEDDRPDVEILSVLRFSLRPVQREANEPSNEGRPASLSDVLFADV